jgi:hypothetical protein
MNMASTPPSVPPSGLPSLSTRGVDYVGLGQIESERRWADALEDHFGRPVDPGRVGCVQTRTGRYVLVEN